MKALVLLSFLLIACNGFNWDPDPYVGVSENQSIMNADGAEVLCEDPQFNTFTCLNEADIADLRNEIRRLQKRKRH